jgi:DNA-directed RNA polymerase specialized sigma24 family protein
MRAGRSEFAIVDALNDDWRELVHRDRGTVRRWSQRQAALAACDSLDDVLSAVQLNSDATLRALITEVSNGEMLAGRIVLQSMLGRLVRMAQRDRQAGIDDYIAALWCVARTYPLAARPVRIAANLSMDAFKAVYRERHWPGQGVVTPWPPHRFTDEAVCYGAACPGRLPDSDEPSATAMGVLDAGCRLRLIDEPTRRLLHSVYVDGLSTAEAARRHLTSPGSVRVRSSKAVKRLAAHAAQLAEAA